MLSVVGKLYGRVLIERVRAGTEYAIREKQCMCRHSRRCMNQAYGKYIVFLALMDLEIVCIIDRHGVRQML